MFQNQKLALKEILQLFINDFDKMATELGYPMIIINQSKKLFFALQPIKRLLIWFLANQKRQI